MKKSILKLILLNTLLSISVSIDAQNLQIKTKTEDILINKDTSFTKNISVVLAQSSEPVIYPIFYDSELEDISDIKLYLKKGKRFKPEKDPFISEEDVDIEYIASKKVKYVVVPPEKEGKITYTVKCNELMYFSDLRLFSYDKVDTLKYKITVPETFHFSHNLIYKDSLDFLVIDSLKSDSSTIWHVEVAPKKVEPNPLLYFGIYKNQKIPLMRIVVVPSIYKKKEKQYMSDWYLHKTESRKGLDSTAASKIDELTKSMSKPMEILDTLFSYVKTNFKYVAIEIGMGAFVPTHANEVFINKQGDCKDLSNFLSEALNYKGIKSNVALASTYNHICDCDFPSLGSANHVICVAYIDDSTILLDPTDPIHLPNTPIQSLQERTILIINQNGGEYHKINPLPPQQNAITYEIELNEDTAHMLLEGKFKTNYNGISGNFLRRGILEIGKEEMNSAGKDFYESVLGNQTISEFDINNHKNKVNVKGKLSVNGKIFNDGGSQFLFFDFLPRIIESEERETLLEGTHLGSTIHKKVKLLITMETPFEAFNPLEHSFSNKGVSLDLKITNPSDGVIECNYEFILDHIFIEEEDLAPVNDILKSFKKITNEPIILKKES